MRLSLLFTLSIFLISCSHDNKIESKGFQVSEITEDDNGKKIVGLQIDSLNLETRPRNVLLTIDNSHRLIPIYKVNYSKEDKTPFTGSNHFHTTWSDDYLAGNNWHNNFMPGFEAMYGYNLVNIAHYNVQTKRQSELFKKPVLIKTFYFPSFSKDTLNNQPIRRDFYMVSVYDDDTNKDGFINVKDLRRFYSFDMNGESQSLLIPKNYSVMSSEYDSANDFMYIFARKDKNDNGQIESTEPYDIFWIDLKNSANHGLLYETN